MYLSFSLSLRHIFAIDAMPLLDIAAAAFIYYVIDDDA